MSANYENYASKNYILWEIYNGSVNVFVACLLDKAKIE